jgi:hypothetical protein
MLTRETIEDRRRRPQINPAVPIRGSATSVVGPFSFLSCCACGRFSIDASLHIPA